MYLIPSGFVFLIRNLFFLDWSDENVRFTVKNSSGCKRSSPFELTEKELLLVIYENVVMVEIIVVAPHGILIFSGKCFSVGQQDSFLSLIIPCKEFGVPNEFFTDILSLS
jgi:hypothetical protein